MRRAAPALAVLLAAAAASASPVPAPGAAEERLFRTDACVFVPEEGERCGFVAVAMNEAGDRLAGATVEGQVQLWNQDGAEIAGFDAAVHGSEQLLFAGDRLFMLASHGELLTVDARTGELLSRFGDLPRDGTLQRLLPGGLLLMRARAEGQPWVDEVLVVSLAFGRIVDRSAVGSPLRHASGRDWAAGVTTRQVAAQVWEGTLHLADEALTRLEIERWCEPLGPRPVCVRRDVDGPNLYLFDLETRRWTVRDMGAPLIGTTMVEWTQAAGRTYASLCALRYVPNSESTYDCRIVDVADGRIVHAFSAARHVMAGATLPGGAAELRLWRQEPGDRSVGTVVRIAAATGEARTLGRFEWAEYSIAGPAGLLWTRAGNWPGRLVAQSPEGFALAHMDQRFGACAGQVVTWHRHGCRVSADRRHIAGIVEGEQILWGRIEWLAEPAAG